MEVLRKTAEMRIAAQQGTLPPEEVTRLSLSSLPLLPELLTPMCNLTHLTLVALRPCLRRLDDVPLASFAVLRVLDVSDNAITVPRAPPVCATLTRLHMANNKLQTLDEVRLLAASFTALQVLDLLDNAVDTVDNTAAIFDAFPALAALDNKTRDGTDVVVRDSDASDSSDSSDEYDDEDDDEYDDSESDDDDDDDDSHTRKRQRSSSSSSSSSSAM